MVYSELIEFDPFFSHCEKKIIIKKSMTHVLTCPLLAHNHHRHIVIILRAVYKYQFNFCHFTETKLFFMLSNSMHCENEWLRQCQRRFKRSGRKKRTHFFPCSQSIASHRKSPLAIFHVYRFEKLTLVLKFQFVSGKQSTRIHTINSNNVSNCKILFSHTENNCNQKI